MMVCTHEVLLVDPWRLFPHPARPADDFGGASDGPTRRNRCPLRSLYGLGLWAGPKGFGNNERAIPSSEYYRFGDAARFQLGLIDWDWASPRPKEGQFDWSSFDRVCRILAARTERRGSFLGHGDAGWNGHPGAKVLRNGSGIKACATAGIRRNGGSAARARLSRPFLTRRSTFPRSRVLIFVRSRYDKPGSAVALSR